MQYVELYKSAGNSKSFLKVLLNNRRMQAAIATLSAGQSTEADEWEADQILLVLLGEGEVSVEGERKYIKSGDAFSVPANNSFEITNLGKSDMKLFVVFSPHILKEDADEGSKLSEIFDPYKVRSHKGI